MEEDNKLSVLDTFLRGLDYAGGIGRTSAMGLANIPYMMYTGDSLTNEEDALNAFKGNAPTTSEFLKRAGVEGTGADAVGFIGDMALDPTTYLTGGATKAPMVMGAVMPFLKNKKWLTMTADGLKNLGVQVPDALKGAVRKAQMLDKEQAALKAVKEKEYFKKLDIAQDKKSLVKQLDHTPSNYPEMVRVQQTWPGGDKSIDWMTGLNKGHAEQMARWNWPAAEKIEVMGTLKNPKYVPKKK